MAITVYVVTEHFEHDGGRFDSVWSTRELAAARAGKIEHRPPQPDWTEIAEAKVDDPDLS